MIAAVDKIEKEIEIASKKIHSNIVKNKLIIETKLVIPLTLDDKKPIACNKRSAKIVKSAIPAKKMKTDNYQKKSRSPVKIIISLHFPRWNG